jgi:hypothetical protein
MKIKMEIELDYDAGIMHDVDKEATEWFYNEILLGSGGDLRLHSNEIGDEVGKVTVLKIL